MNTWTKGPWEAETGENGGVKDQAAVFDANDKMIANCADLIEETRPVSESQANARLIAAAPDFATAIAELKNCMTRNDAGMWFVKQGRNASYNIAIEALFAALSRARGEQ